MEERRTGSAAAGKPKKSGGFLAQGSIYAASGVISSLIGLVYRMPLTRIIGDEGNGYYAAAFNIYAIILLLSSYSLPLAVSKLISARALREVRSTQLPPALRADKSSRRAARGAEHRVLRESG